MILDRQIQEEETRKREYFQLKSKNNLKKITGTTEKEADVGDNHQMVSPVKFSSSFKPGSPFQNLNEILEIPRKAPILPKLPTFLESLSVTIGDPAGATPVKSRGVEASMLRIQSKTERQLCS